MVRDWGEMERFEWEFQRRERLTLEQRFKIFSAMVEHARAMGVFPLNDPLEGIEKDIELAKILRKHAEFVKKSGRGFRQSRD